MQSLEIYRAGSHPRLCSSKKPPLTFRKMAVMSVFIWLGWKNWQTSDWDPVDVQNARSECPGLTENDAFSMGPCTSQRPAYVLWNEIASKSYQTTITTLVWVSSPVTKKEGCPGPVRMIQVLRIHTSATRSLNIWQWYVYFFPQCVVPENKCVPPRGYINNLGESELNTWRTQARLFVYHNEHKSKALLRERGEDEQKQSLPASGGMGSVDMSYGC